MSIDTLYRGPLGRMTVILLQRTGMFHLVSCFLKTGASKKLIHGYIAKHRIDMRDFKGQNYQSFAEFFARKRETASYVITPEVLISPCDGLLSIYQITEGMTIAIKGSHYCLADLVPDKAAAAQFADGLCLVFRLRASDYHHFCAFDDIVVENVNYIPGRLHSVQPIACEKVPVFRQNRRWWSRLDTAHFGNAIQIEIGAMLVGEVHFVKGTGWHSRGEEMGNFELAGSTILLLLTSGIRKRLNLEAGFRDAVNGATEKPVSMGEGIGVLQCEQ